MKVKVAVVQEGSVFFDKKETFKKLESLVVQYSKEGCELIVFPESFIPGYPRGFTFGANIGKRTEEGRLLYKEYYDNSVSLSGNDMVFLEKVAAENKTYIVVGITERQDDNGSLFCSMVYISPFTGLLGVHRKIKPTGSERIIWAESDGTSLVSFDTKIGKLGGLICWENYMPLARMAMYQKAVEIYIAPTADSRDEWTSTMRHIALEGRCFVLGCNQYFTKKMYPKKYQHLIQEENEEICSGGSIIIGPNGQIIAGPLFHKSGGLTAVLDLEEITKNKLDFDVNGHYSRFDIFDFKVNGQPEIAKDKYK